MLMFEGLIKAALQGTELSAGGTNWSLPRYMQRQKYRLTKCRGGCKWKATQIGKCNDLG